MVKPGMLRRALFDYCSDQSGNLAMIFGCAAIPLLALGGGAMDYSRANLNEKAIQSALDAAVLAGITRSQNLDEQIAVATAYFDANRDPEVAVQSVSFQHNGKILVGNATSNVATSFLKLVQLPTLAVSATSSGTAEQYREPACVMAMHPTRKHTLDLDGSVDVIGGDCNFYGNSTNPDDVVDPHNASNFLTGKSVQANGYGHHYIENVTPPLEHAPEVLSDPLASKVIPTASATCLFTGKKVDGVSQTLSPGTYCNGLQIVNGATVTLQSGTYFIKGNRFLVKGSTVTGTGVTIVFVDNHSAIDWQTSTIRLTAPTIGSEAGIVLMGQRVSVDNSIDKATVDLEGVVYLPQGAFTWVNTGTPTITAKWTAWIVDGFAWSGDGVIRMNFDYKHGVPYPEELKNVVPRPGTPRLLS
jgi:Flp pilus assembly protein TadG